MSSKKSLPSSNEIEKDDIFYAIVQNLEKKNSLASIDGNINIQPRENSRSRETSPKKPEVSQDNVSDVKESNWSGGERLSTNKLSMVLGDMQERLNESTINDDSAVSHENNGLDHKTGDENSLSSLSSSDSAKQKRKETETTDMAAKPTKAELGSSAKLSLSTDTSAFSKQPSKSNGLQSPKPSATGPTLTRSSSRGSASGTRLNSTPSASGSIRGSSAKIGSSSSPGSKRETPGVLRNNSVNRGSFSKVNSSTSIGMNSSGRNLVNPNQQRPNTVTRKSLAADKSAPSEERPTVKKTLSSRTGSTNRFSASNTSSSSLEAKKSSLPRSTSSTRASLSSPSSASKVAPNRNSVSVSSSVSGTQRSTSANRSRIPSSRSTTPNGTTSKTGTSAVAGATARGRATTPTSTSTLKRSSSAGATARPSIATSRGGSPGATSKSSSLNRSSSVGAGSRSSTPNRTAGVDPKRSSVSPTSKKPIERKSRTPTAASSPPSATKRSSSAGTVSRTKSASNISSTARSSSNDSRGLARSRSNSQGSTASSNIGRSSSASKLGVRKPSTKGSHENLEQVKKKMDLGAVGDTTGVKKSSSSAEKLQVNTESVSVGISKKPVRRPSGSSLIPSRSVSKKEETTRSLSAGSSSSAGRRSVGGGSFSSAPTTGQRTTSPHSVKSRLGPFTPSSQSNSSTTAYISPPRSLSRKQYPEADKLKILTGDDDSVRASNFDFAEFDQTDMAGYSTLPFKVEHSNDKYVKKPPPVYMPALRGSVQSVVDTLYFNLTRTETPKKRVGNVSNVWSIQGLTAMHGQSLYETEVFAVTDPVDLFVDPKQNSSLSKDKSREYPAHVSTEIVTISPKEVKKSTSDEGAEGDNYITSKSPPMEPPVPPNLDKKASKGNHLSIDTVLEAGSAPATGSTTGEVSSPSVKGLMKLQGKSVTLSPDSSNQSPKFSNLSPFRRETPEQKEVRNSLRNAARMSQKQLLPEKY